MVMEMLTPEQIGLSAGAAVVVRYRKSRSAATDARVLPGVLSALGAQDAFTVRRGGIFPCVRVLRDHVVREYIGRPLSRLPITTER